jgi:hypothetical protein
MPSKTPSWMSPSLDPPIESPACPSKMFSELGLKQPNNVVDCLGKLHASKESRNTLKGLDYDAVKFLRMDFLLLVFNSDVVYELPSIGRFVGNSQAEIHGGNGQETQWTHLDQNYYILYQE